ncbi:MAG: fibronectin type III domain-containing protein, partial [bacterium]
MKPLIASSLRFSVVVLGIGVFLGGCTKEKSNPVIPPPSAPSNLTITVLSPTSVRLSWRDNSFNETGFEIERAVEQEEFQMLVRLSADVNRWTDTSLSEGTLARYRVVAISRNSRSVPSNEAQALTPLFTPTQLTAQKISGRQINLTWQDNSQKETGYQIQRRQLGRSWVLITTTTPNTTEYSDTALVEENFWDYRVRAVKDDISSEWSNIVRADTDVPTPAAPTELEARPVSQMSIALQWVDNSLDELGFVVEVSRSPESGFQPRDTTRENVTNTLVGNLNSQTTYYFRVYAYNDSGNSPYSNIASATTPAGPPLPPSDLTGTAPTYRAVILTWRDNSDNEESFHLERKLTISNIWSSLADLTANTTSYVDSNVVPGASYNYRLYARNAMGSSPYSNEIRVVIPSGSPNPPSDLDAVPIHYRQVDLTWRDNSDDELGFTIQRRLVGTSTWTTLGDVGANVTQYSDETVSPLTS